MESPQPAWKTISRSLRHRSAGWPGRHRPSAVQQERERVPLRGGERGCCLGQFPDPGIQAAAGVACGVPVVVVTLVALGCRRPGRGCPADLPSRFLFPAAALIPWYA